MLDKPDIVEAADIILLAIDMLLATSNDQKGRVGSDLRRSCGDMKSYVQSYIVNNQIAEKLSNCFKQAQLSGATLDEFDRIRSAVDAEMPTSLLATLMQQACISYALQQMAIVIVGMKFTSRDDVDVIRLSINEAFSAAEEYAADAMAQATYIALIALHAAVVFYLYQTARPLPRMLRFEFGAIRPTLVLSHRLYYSASHADELREENKVVHPAFAPRAGRALSPQN